MEGRQIKRLHLEYCHKGRIDECMAACSVSHKCLSRTGRIHSPETPWHPPTSELWAVYRSCVALQMPHLTPLQMYDHTRMVQQLLLEQAVASQSGPCKAGEANEYGSWLVVLRRL